VAPRLVMQQLYDVASDMPVGYAQSEATFRAIPPDLGDAGRILGGGRSGSSCS